jgi:hypothetical protein
VARPIPPRIVRVRYCSERREGIPARRAECFVKVPYGMSIYDLSAALTRATVTRQVRWWQVTVPRTVTAEARASLARWPEALRETSRRTGVSWA